MGRRCGILMANYAGQRAVLMDRFNIGDGMGARGGGIRGAVWSAWRALGRADDDMALAGRALLFAFACFLAGGLLLLWGSRIGNLYLGLAGVATILLAELLWVALGTKLLWKLARLIWGGYRAWRLKSLSKGKTGTQ